MRSASRTAAAGSSTRRYSSCARPSLTSLEPSVPELPPPLPPAERTVVQLVAETIRAYGAQFWRVLPLGVPVAVATQISLGRSGDLDTVVLLALAPGFALAFVVACRLVVGG